MIRLTKHELDTWIDFLDKTRSTIADETENGNEPGFYMSKKECKVLNKVINQVHEQHTYGITPRF